MKSANKNTILYIAPSLSSFIKSDIALLSSRYPVFVNTYAWNKKYWVPFYLLHQIFFLLKHIRSTRKIFVSFGGYWSFFPALAGRLAGIDVYIILNGTDCAAIPPLHYGNLRSHPLKWFCHQSYKMASMLLPVSSSLVSVKNTYFSKDIFSFQGYKHFFPKLKTQSRVVHNGFDKDFWSPPKNNKKEPLTFMAVFSASQFILKGGDLIVQLAEKFPNCKFYIAGTKKPATLKIENKNLIFLGKLTSNELRACYRRFRFYLQLSAFEGFGCALGEAMLCECIPIGSRVNIIPEIIGDTGFVVAKREIQALEIVVHKALSVKDKTSLGKKARERIADKYSIEKRESALFSLIEK